MRNIILMMPVSADGFTLIIGTPAGRHADIPAQAAPTMAAVGAFWPSLLFPDHDPVPLGNSIVSLTCLFACAAGVVMVGWPGAAQDRLPAHALVIQPGYSGDPR